MKKNTIVVYTALDNNYLSDILIDIRILDWISKQNNLPEKEQIYQIKYRSSGDKFLNNYSKKYLEKGKWFDFLFTPNKDEFIGYFNKNFGNLHFLDHFYTIMCIKVSLFIFWKQIKLKLSSLTSIKIQLKATLVRIAKDDSNNWSEKEEFRSLNYMQVVKRDNLSELFEVFVGHVSMLSEWYSQFYVKTINLTYSISKEGSTLNTKPSILVF